MKKAMRFILPLLLAVAVVGCAVWYLFVYDRDFTRDILLSEARYFERQGNHNIAAWFYDLAYFQADQDEDVAIELAEQYKASGNYTKAEYTLSSAIADGGSAKLYTALSKTYVEQNKLLDAVDMLNNIADPVMKAELDALRPSAPAVDPAPGFYTEYISVSVSTSFGTLYVTTNGQYPSLSDEPYSEPITLRQGETVIYALSVAENGLVSPLSIYGYTVGGVIEKVTFTDAAFEASVRSVLGVDDDDTLYSSDLWTITSFTMPDDAQTYQDLVWLPYLHSLIIQNGLEGEFGYIGSLKSLQELILSNCRPNEEELAAIASIPTLEKLTLYDCGLSSIAELSMAQGLTYLDLSSNNVRNITPISGMNGLQELRLRRNALTDLSALSGLNNLSILDISFNSISSIAPICSIKSLTWLDAGSNALSTLGAIDNLTGLTYLSVAYTGISDVSPIAKCVGLTELDISNNDISDILALETLNALETFDFSYNHVTALPAFSESCKLVTIDGSYNQLSSLEALSGLSRLNQVLMDYNQDISSIDCLTSCGNLYQVNVFGTDVVDASALTDMDIIVNFDPSTARAEAIS